MSRLKGGVEAAIVLGPSDPDNDTPAQSQPHRDMGSRNEGSSVRTAEGLDPRETR